MLKNAIFLTHGRTDMTARWFCWPMERRRRRTEAMVVLLATVAPIWQRAGLVLLMDRRRRRTKAAAVRLATVVPIWQRVGGLVWSIRRRRRRIEAVAVRPATNPGDGFGERAATVTAAAVAVSAAALNVCQSRRKCYGTVCLLISVRRPSNLSFYASEVFQIGVSQIARQ